MLLLFAGSERDRIKVIVSSSLSARVHITDLMGDKARNKETEIRQYFPKQVNAVR